MSDKDIKINTDEAENIDELPVTDEEASETENAPADKENNKKDSGEIPGSKKEASSDKKDKKKKTSAPAKNTDGNEKGMSRKTRHAIISAAISIVTIAAVVLVNIIASTLTEKFTGFTSDITAMRSFELSDQSIEVANNVGKKVEITFLSDKNTYVELDPYCKQTSYIAENLAKASDGMISVQYIDLLRNPRFADNYSEKELSSTDIIISCGDNSQILTANDIFTFDYYYGDYQYIRSSKSEEMIDNAIVNVSAEERTKAVIITDNTNQDFSYFKGMLNTNGYDVSELSLQDSDIGSDVHTVFIYSPSRDYPEESVKKLRSFLLNDGQYGKNLVFASDSKDVEMPNLDGLLEEYGMRIEHSLVFETDESKILSGSSSYYDGIMCYYLSEDYTENMGKSPSPVITGYSRPVSIVGQNAEALLVLSDKSGDCPFTITDENWNPEEHITGKECVIARGKYGTEKAYSTVIVTGTYNVFTQTYFGAGYGNKMYFITMLADLNGRKVSNISVDEKVITDYDLQIDRTTAVNLGFIVYAFLPILILGIGLTVFLIRRHK